jgi:hypothetical protein
MRRLTAALAVPPLIAILRLIMLLKILSHPIFVNLNFHMPMLVDLSHPLVIFDAEQNNPRMQLELFRDQPEMIEFLQLASHGQVMLAMFRENFPSLQRGTTLLLDEPEMALSLSNQRRILKMLKELVDQRDFRIVCATHSLVLLDDPDTCVINLDEHVNRNAPVESFRASSTIQ